MRPALQTVVVIVSSMVLLPAAARAQENPDWRRAIRPVAKVDHVPHDRDQAFEKLTRQRAEAGAGDAVGFDLEWNHVALSVPNIAESIAWYEKMLGFKGTVRNGQPGARQQIADLRRGDITIELFQVPDAAQLPESRKNPSEDFRTHGVKHFGFEVKNLA